MKSYKPTFESIEPNFGHSYLYQKFDQTHKNKDNTWHYHPEIELVYINGGAGKRRIGSHISYFTDGDLILIGSNLPHCGFTDRFTGNKNEIVIQLLPDFLGEHFFNAPEMKKIKNLFEKAKGGIAFSCETKKIVGNKMEQLCELSEFDRLLSILSMLNELANSQEFNVLNAEGMLLETEIKDNDRINIIFNHVKNNFQHDIPLPEIAEMVGMTVPSFCRYFKKVTNKTFVQFVNERRLVHASKLLTEQKMSITDVCFECGFNNFSHFNKSFKVFTGHSPSQYRKQLMTVLN